ncbi:hypothetical protein FOZ61_009436 [Perkinsus olseni]|uniref:Uncharacterized protein n=1 Tax=Perkinsus olseni TaxID=32597 RepID=A0A7J6M550_PEROL|nr:hypothetical protein FOZ61_009436 [Perkinsus olseni]KAF4671635.1 hypothetical protein FOL46_000132 [Perkinsus olseni]KAF4688503.1 hypothetical protein FOZ60_002773 [Perkinsus olseni]KAF4754439.1 hypothetical protein FOZ62_025624 [Perkinsus olseni]
MTLAVYHRLWGMTEQFAARKKWGWRQVYHRMLPFQVAFYPSLMWYLFGWFDDPYKEAMTLGVWNVSKRSLYFWDPLRSGGDKGWYP